ncbi:Hydrogen peroxide-inducible genes activator [wastewater metagenome]|uniref:Hydrogen peroxide-inducible genes activator n=2 Tax=unclassified sequences TaxID=12908 RepID=A0A5B8R9T8_9ZZZZ|nr:MULTISPECIES: LysR substrate-binding domain-containing protein [Arhodomonas]MCS4504916.1 LysR substrate-binding domain-containing protein [Arhodomonas aquaeolei]QEA04132.1 hydrogen peroxide-inducible genes activator [uncultured organism]
MVHINFRDLRYLVAVADHRHFGRAAAACYVSQPTLSTQIKKLEQYLGVQLVERTNKQVMLTPIGKMIAERARHVLNEVSDIVDSARAAGDPMVGDLRLGLIPTIGPYLLPHLIPALRSTYPNLRPLLYEQQTADLLERLRRGELDAAVMAVPVPGEGLLHASLFHEPFYLAMPHDHPLARKPEVSLGDIESEHILLLEEGHCLRDQALDVCNMVGAREDAGFRATSMETLRQMVAAGAGITLLPALAAKAAVGQPDSNAVVLRSFVDARPTREMALYWRKGSAREPTIRAIAEVIHGLEAVHELSGEAVELAG